MNIDQWQAVGVVCGALLALFTLVGLVYRRVVRPMWARSRRTYKLATQLIEQLVGDADEGVPSLMDQLGAFRRTQADIERKLDDHLEWHAGPGARAARPATQPNGQRQRRI